MSAEILRRMKTTFEYLSKNEHQNILVTFMDELSAMGHPLEWRLKILHSSIKGYMRVLKKVEDGVVTRNRQGYTTNTHRRFKKLCGKTVWFEDHQDEETHWEGTSTTTILRGRKQTGRQKVTEGVIFIPHFPGSKLKKQLNEMEAEGTGKTRIKYI